ncbi:MAG: glutathione S-transferase family protein [Cyanobacteria bacterium]|nr:glutathione S-transferase family protein [Cyanobacteriota bacterium]MDA1247366.1 glutathione S-transferase family protein [Cyanobacteriota bacterium]
MGSTSDEVLNWQELTNLGTQPEDPINGAASAQANLRLFGHREQDVRVTLFRDHHAWCPYCQKVWLWLEERRVPYRIRKVTMFCYGEKEAWFKRLVPSGMLPALELDGRLITESDRILEALEAAFAPLGLGMNDPAVLPLRQLERLLFRAWCQWLCSPGLRPAQEEAAKAAFQQIAAKFERALCHQSGKFLLGELGTADLVFVPYVERMSASLAYYKGFLLRSEHPAIGSWFEALEQRPSYLGTQSDFHTHTHDLPPQMGGCYANGTASQQALATQIDRGPWPLGSPDPETSQTEPANATVFALSRVIKHRAAILGRSPLGAENFDVPLRTALTALILAKPLPAPAGSAPALRYLRDRISVPRDMPLHAARRLRQALETTASLDPLAGTAQGEPLPFAHRRDQDPKPFLQAAQKVFPVA